jgi:hypothetical protein
MLTNLQHYHPTDKILWQGRKDRLLGERFFNTLNARTSLRVLLQIKKTQPYSGFVVMRGFDVMKGERARNSLGSL